MVPYSIPTPHLELISTLAKLKNPEFDRLIFNLKKVKLTDSFEQIEQYIEESGVITPVFAKVIFALFSLKHKTNYSNAKLTKEFTESIIFEDKNLLKLGSKISARLNKILSLDRNLGLVIKAYGLYGENDKIINNSRIITDIRPAFSCDDKGNEIMEDVIIIHNLKIQYQKNKRVEDIILSVPSDELELLKENIIRAQSKEQLIKSKFKTTIKFIDPN